MSRPRARFISLRRYDPGTAKMRRARQSMTVELMRLARRRRGAGLKPKEASVSGMA